MTKDQLAELKKAKELLIEYDKFGLRKYHGSGLILLEEHVQALLDAKSMWSRAEEREKILKKVRKHKDRNCFLPDELERDLLNPQSP